jgi:hypothetical protein
LGRVEPFNDPYRTCEDGRCNHDLARAVSITDLLGDDGPFPPSYLVVSLSMNGPSLFDDAETALESVRRAS